MFFFLPLRLFEVRGESNVCKLGVGSIYLLLRKKQKKCFLVEEFKKEMFSNEL